MTAADVTPKHQAWRKFRDHAIAGARAETDPIVATFEGWTLHVQPQRSRGWLNFVLVSPERITEKRKFRLGHNSERFANGHDAKVLQQHHPDVHAWFQQVLSR